MLYMTLYCAFYDTIVKLKKAAMAMHFLLSWQNILLAGASQCSPLIQTLPVVGDSHATNDKLEVAGAHNRLARH